MDGPQARMQRPNACDEPMRFFNIAMVKADIREGRLTEAEIFKYLIATFIAVFLLSLPDTEGAVSLTPSLVIGAINLWGLRKSYLANGAAKGTCFIGRLLSIGWVLGLRGFIVLIASYPVLAVALALVVGDFQDGQASDGTAIYEYLGYTCFAIYNIWCYFRLSCHLKDLRTSA